MTEEPVEENKTKDIKFYSKKAIGITTFLGGPLAAGYLIRENYLALNKPKEGRNALIIGIICTIILFGTLFIIPERIIDKIPNKLIPFIYTGIILLIVERTQGKILTKHKEFDNKSFSGWRAFLVGLVSAIIILIGVLGFVEYSSEGPEYEKYNVEIVNFSRNEKVSLEFFDIVKTEPNNILIKELDSNSIPRWKENINIIKQSNKIKIYHTNYYSKIRFY